MPKSKPAASYEVTVAMDRVPDLSGKNRAVLESALTPPYSPVEWGLLRKAVFVPVEAKGVIVLIHEFLEDRARDPRREKASRELCRKAAMIMSRDANFPLKAAPGKVRHYRASRAPKA